eukprot:8569045-Alexandrium_andersonii.AAC.1
MASSISRLARVGLLGNASMQHAQLVATTWHLYKEWWITMTYTGCYGCHSSKWQDIARAWVRSQSILADS